MSARTHTTEKYPSNLHTSTPKPGKHSATEKISSVLQRAFTLAEKNDLPAAVALLRASGRDVAIVNALGVCLMRLGQIEEAVRVFRGFVLIPGTVLERPEISNACKRNFATALLMMGYPSGAQDVLKETHEPENPRTIQLRDAIRRWEKSLSWFRRLDWKLNRIEPRNCHVPIDFEPGEFDLEVVKQKPNNPLKPSWKLAA